MKYTLKYPPLEGIIFGLILHAFGGYVFFISNPIGYALCGLSILIILANVMFRISSYKQPFKSFTRVFFYLYLFWILIILIRPLIFDSLIPLQSGFSPVSPYLGLSYVVPLIAFLGIRNLPLTSILKYSYFYGILGLILVIINFQTIFSIPPILDFEEYQKHINIIGFPVSFLSTCTFLLLFSFTLNTRYKRVSQISIFLSIVITLISGRRGAVVMSLLLILFASNIYINNQKKGSKYFKILFIAFIIGASVLIFFMFADSTFSFFFQRIEEGASSRTGIEEFFWDSFKNKPFDWIVGRGINGTYPSPYIEMPNRNIIETGYLQLILTGGIINLFFYILFLGHSAYLGLFKSKNLVSKAMALYLLYHIIYLYPFGLPSFTFEYLIVWIFILYCQNRNWRLKTNEEINAFITIK